MKHTASRRGDMILERWLHHSLPAPILYLHHSLPSPFFACTILYLHHSLPAPFLTCTILCLHPFLPAPFFNNYLYLSISLTHLQTLFAINCTIVATTHDDAASITAPSTVQLLSNCTTHVHLFATAPALHLHHTPRCYAPGSYAHAPMRSPATGLSVHI